MASWMVRRGAKTIGPFSTKVIQDKAREGQLLPADQVKQVGQLDWRAAASIRGLFSAEAIQQAASASPQGNNVLGEGIPEALPINNQGIDAVIPEALPANTPAPPAFQKKSVTGHTNTKRNLIIVSSSVGGIVLITAIALVIIFNLPSSETDDIIPVESDEKTTVVVEDVNNQTANTASSNPKTSPLSGSEDRYEIIVDRFGKSVSVPPVVLNEGTTPIDLMHGKWICQHEEAPIDGKMLKNGPWPESESTVIYIDTSGPKNYLTLVSGKGGVDEYVFRLSRQNIKTGVVTVERWFKRHDERADPGASRNTWFIGSDGSMIQTEPFFGDTKKIFWRRIGDQATL